MQNKIPYGVIIDTDDCSIWEIDSNNTGNYRKSITKIVPSKKWLMDLKSAMNNLKKARQRIEDNELKTIHEIYKKAKWVSENINE